MASLLNGNNMEKVVSKYKNNSIASAKKHVFSRLFDYFLTFILSYFIFILSYSLVCRIPAIEANFKDLQNISLESAEYVDYTHLQRLNDDKTALSNINEDGVNYITNLVKTSVYYHDLEYAYHNEDGTYTSKKVTIEETFFYNSDQYTLDNIAYFYKKIKTSEPGLEYESGVYINKYLYVDVMELNSTYFINADEANYQPYKDTLSTYVILNEESTITILPRVAKGETINSNATNMYNHLLGGYLKAINNGVEDVEKNSLKYKDISERFSKSYQRVIGTIAGIYFAAYFVSYIVLIFLGRLISKEWITIGQKVMRLVMNDKNEMEISLWRMVVYHFTSLILFITSAPIAFTLFGMLGILSFEVIPHITLLAILLFVLTFNLVSLFLSIFNKKYHHDISTFVSGIYVKDINEFDVPVAEQTESNNE